MLRWTRNTFTSQSIHFSKAVVTVSILRKINFQQKRRKTIRAHFYKMVLNTRYSQVVGFKEEKARTIDSII